MRRDARFWNRIARRYARAAVPDEAVYRRKLEITQRYLSPEMQVLELGCGTGSTALAHARHVAHLRALDIAPAMIEIAEEKRKAAGIGNVSFEIGGLEELDAPDASFDAVLALNLLHLLPDRDAALARIHALLRPGGVFVSSTLCGADDLRWLQPAVALGGRLGLIPRVRFFSAAALRDSLRRAGFDIVEDWQPARRSALFLVARKPG